MSVARPKFATGRVPGRESYGDEVAEFAESVLGIELMDWQRQVIGVALEVQESGRLFHHDTVVTVSRQQGKSVLLAVVAAWWMLRWPDQHIMFLAQTRSAAANRLEGVARALALGGVGGVKWFRGIGNERIEADNGSRIRVESPNIHGSHGETFDLILLDEAFSYGEHVLQGVLPTQTALPNSSLWMVSTQGDEDSDVFNRYCSRGRDAVDDPDSSTAYFEWSMPDGCDVFDSDRFGEWMPAIGVTTEAANIMPALLAMAPGEALRAYGNVLTRSDASVFPVEWIDAASKGKLPKPVEGLVVSVDVGRRGAGVAVGVGWVADGVVVGDLAEYRVGGSTGWVAGRVRELVSKYRCENVVMSYGPAITVKPVLEALVEELGVVLWDLNVSQTAAAAMGLFELLKDGDVRVGSPEPLREAMLAARSKSVADRWRFDREVFVDQSPLVAVSVAVDVARQLSLKPAGAFVM